MYKRRRHHVTELTRRVFRMRKKSNLFYPVGRGKREGASAGHADKVGILYVCVLVAKKISRAVQARALHSSAARQFNFAKFSDAVTSNEAR